jgi:hypothetical protein
LGIALKRGYRPVKVLAVLAVSILAVVLATTALAATRDQRWSGVANGFQSQNWYSFAKGNHTFSRYTCSHNGGGSIWTTFTLYHQRGGLPDENKGNMLYRATCNGVNYHGSAYSNDTQNHYWRVFFPYQGSWHRTSGTGRMAYPG